MLLLWAECYALEAKRLLKMIFTKVNLHSINILFGMLFSLNFMEWFSGFQVKTLKGHIKLLMPHQHAFTCGWYAFLWWLPFSKCRLFGIFTFWSSPSFIKLLIMNSLYLAFVRTKFHLSTVVLIVLLSFLFCFFFFFFLFGVLEKLKIAMGRVTLIVFVSVLMWLDDAVTIYIFI